MPRLFIRLTFALVLLLGLFSLINNAPVRADSPDLANVADILGGQRRLFPVDDLVISEALPGQSSVTNLIVETENGLLGSHDTYGTGLDSKFANGVGRMFDSARDVVVTVGNGAVVIRDQNPDGVTTKTFPLNVSGAPNQNQFPMADFTGDGFADFAYIVGSSIYILTAQNVENMDDGLFFSQAGAAPFDLTGQWVSLAAGDFDGNGRPEVALAAAQFNHITVTLYNVDVFKNIQGHLTSITLTPSGSTTFDIPADVLGMELVAGVYTDGANAQTSLPLADLVVLYHYNKGKHYADLASLQIEIATLDPTTFSLSVADTLTWVESDHDLQFLSMVSERLNFFGDTDQIVATVQEPLNYSHLAVFTLDNNLNLTRATEQIHEENSSNVVSLAVGNFDQDLNPQEPIQLDVAVLRYYSELGFNMQAELLLYRVDPTNNFELTQYSNGYVGSVVNPDPFLSANLNAGDTQGRSLLLGPPTRVISTFTQPEVILAMPPMHVDWITPSGATQPEVLNLSAVPLGFFASYDTDDSTTKKSSHEGTSSYSQSFTESSDQTFSYGAPDVDSVSVNVKFSATQKWENTTSKKYDNYSTDHYTASTQTGFDDQLWFKIETQNVYVYPVIGQYTCPPKDPPQPPPIPLCHPDDLVQVNVMFSAPDGGIQQMDGGGALLEWYHPVREPGNILSYPWNLQQLQILEPHMDLLTSSSENEFTTNDAVEVRQAQWEAGGGNTVTAGSTHNYSWDTSVSLSTNAEIPEAGGIGAANSATFSYGGSVGFSTMNSTTTSLSASTGIGVTKPGTFLDYDEYEYTVGPYIYGSQLITRTIQNIQLGTDIQTHGILRADFTADPTGSNGGAWWQQNPYTLPDVALNHPARWQISPQTSGTQTSNCLAIGPGTTTLDCATFNAPTSDIWQSQFYWMKGLLITAKEAKGQGPQITQAKAGDQVQLQARVYNYSLTDMPQGSTVQVQFYGQPWDETTLGPTDDAFLIDQVSLAPIPAFNSLSNNGEFPNWVMASTENLNTTAYADQYLAFWIVVWIQDTNGNLSGEMQDHGLTQKPGTFDSIADVTPLLEQYSNNIGFYKSLFYVAPPSSERSPQRSTAAQAEATERLRMDPIQLSKQTALLNEKIIVSANVRANRDREGLAVFFYDGDPDKKGKLFEYEGISHLRGDGFHQVKTIYQADQCGTHAIILELQPGGKRSEATLEVTIKARAAVRQLLKLIKALDLKDGRGGGGFMELLKEAKKAFKNHDNKAGLDALEKFQERVQAQRGNKIPADQADLMLAILAQIFDCVKR